MLAWLSVWSEMQTCIWPSWMPLPLTVSCFNEIQIGFTFLVTAHLGSPGKRAVKRVCGVCSTFLAFIKSSLNYAILHARHLQRSLQACRLDSIKDGIVNKTNVTEVSHSIKMQRVLRGLLWINLSSKKEQQEHSGVLIYVEWKHNTMFSSLHAHRHTGCIVLSFNVCSTEVGVGQSLCKSEQ